jgi:hypothetical protein
LSSPSRDIGNSSAAYGAECEQEAGDITPPGRALLLRLALRDRGDAAECADPLAAIKTSSVAALRLCSGEAPPSAMRQKSQSTMAISLSGTEQQPQ